MVDIRLETPDDEPQVRAVNEAAFGRPEEAGIVDRLRISCPEAISLVADDGGEVVGHIIFTVAFIDSPKGKLWGRGLAVMAVLPDRKRQGIGSKLAERGLDLLREEECPFVIVVGHAEYYPRFGFTRASGYKLTSQWENMPDEAFMVLVFDQGAMQGVSGVAAYRDDEFSQAM
jgi:putative acetyltransferase